MHYIANFARTGYVLKIYYIVQEFLIAKHFETVKVTGDIFRYCHLGRWAISYVAQV